MGLFLGSSESICFIKSIARINNFTTGGDFDVDGGKIVGNDGRLISLDNLRRVFAEERCAAGKSK